MLKRYLVLSVVTAAFHYLLWSMLHNKTFLACTIRMDELRHCGPSKLQLRAITVSYLKPGTISRNKILKVSSLRSPLNFILIK